MFDPSILIPPQYRLAAKAAFLLLVLTSAFFYGRRTVNVQWTIAQQAEQLESARIMAAATQRANDVAIQLAESKNQLQVNHDKALADINSARSELEHLRLRDPGKSRVDPVSEGGRLPNVVDAEGGTVLSDEAAKFLLGEAYRADLYAEQLNSCIGRIQALENQFR